MQVPVLADITGAARRVKAMMWANRNGNFYVLDRATGQVPARQAVREGELDERVRRARPAASRRRSRPGSRPTRAIRAGRTGTRRRTARAPGSSTSPRGKTTRRIFGGTPVEYQEGRNFGGGGPRTVRAGARRAGGSGIRRGPINNWTEAAGHGAVIALDPATGEQKWKFKMTDVTDSGILTTASDLLFTGGREGYFQALDARTGALLWKASLGAQIVSGPITYEVDGKQYVTAISGLSLFVFGLRE